MKLLQKKFMDNNFEVIMMTDVNPQEQLPHTMAYHDDELKNINFGDLTFNTEKHPTSWEKAFYHIYKNKLTYDYYYFIEEDVYCNNLDTFIDAFKSLENIPSDLVATKIESFTKSRWVHFKQGHIKKLYKGPPHHILYRSFNPFCRISQNLMNKLFEFYEQYNCFYYNEMMFSTICFNNSLSAIDFKKHPLLSPYFGTFIFISGEEKIRRYITVEEKQELFSTDKIVHPRKHNVDMHKLLNINIV